MSETSLLDTLVALETTVWGALVQGDADADRALLDPAFLGVYPDGFSGRDAHCGQLGAGPTVQDYAIEDPRTLALGPDHALLSYRARYRRPRGAEEVMYVSSVWQRQKDGWINIFSQDTPAEDG